MKFVFTKFIDYICIQNLKIMKSFLIWLCVLIVCTSVNFYGCNRTIIHNEECKKSDKYSYSSCGKVTFKDRAVSKEGKITYTLSYKEFNTNTIIEKDVTPTDWNESKKGSVICFRVFKSNFDRLQSITILCGFIMVISIFVLGHIKEEEGIDWGDFIEYRDELIKRHLHL